MLIHIRFLSILPYPVALKVVNRAAKEYRASEKAYSSIVPTLPPTSLVPPIGP